MAQAGEFRFRIENVTPETLSMARLADYLRELAILFGETSAVHFVTVETGSAMPVIRVDPDALPIINERLSAVRRGDGPAEAMRAYRNLDERLRRNDSRAILTAYDGSNVLPFPGRSDEAGELRNIEQPSSLDGEIIRIGGPRKEVRIILRSADALLSDLTTDRALAKELARHLFEPVRLYGSGRWSRRVDGRWVLERLRVEKFDVLLNDSLPVALAALQSLQNRWDDRIEAILSNDREDLEG